MKNLNDSKLISKSSSYSNNNHKSYVKQAFLDSIVKKFTEPLYPGGGIFISENNNGIFTRQFNSIFS